MSAVYDVYVTATLLVPRDIDAETPLLALENVKGPLTSDEAVKLAQSLTKRATVGYIRIVNKIDDSTVMEWHRSLGTRIESGQWSSEIAAMLAKDAYFD